jgi:hypothetical protein
VTNVPAVLDPLAAIWLRLQYVLGFARNRPVTRNDTSLLLTRSRSRSTSPGAVCSKAAAVAGSAAGIGAPGTGAAGQVPASRCACEVRPSKAAASAIGISFPFLAGSPSGSDQYAW